MNGGFYERIEMKEELATDARGGAPEFSNKKEKPHNAPLIIGGAWEGGN